MRLALALLCCAATACVHDPRGRCAKDADCAGGAAGLFCAEGVCQAPPAVVLEEVPRAFSARSGTATVRARVTRAHGIATARLSFGSAAVDGAAEADGRFRFDVPLLAAPAGVEAAVPFAVVATDDLGHATTVRDALSVDDLAPRVAVDAATLPAAPVVRGTVVSLRVTAQDATAVTLAAGAEQVTPLGGGVFVVRVDTAVAAAGASAVDVAMTATDAVGNASVAHAVVGITRLRWRTQPASPSHIVGLALADSVLVATSSSQTALVIHRDTGALDAVQPLIGGAAVGDVATNGTDFFSSRVDSKICRISLDGTQRWCRGPYGTLHSGPALWNSDIAILATSGSSSSGGQRLLAVSNAGTPIGTQPLVDFDLSAPSIAPDGTIYAGALQAVVAARFDGFNFTGLPTSESPRYRGAPAPRAAAGAVLLATTAGSLDTFAFPSDVLHSQPPPPLSTQVSSSSIFAITAPTLAADGTAVVGTDDHRVVALSPNGAPRWATTLHSVPSAPPTNGAGGLVYAGTDDGTLYALSLADGSVLWSFAAGSAIRTPPAAGCDGTLYFGTDDGAVFALVIDAPGLADSTWPRAGHDVRGTGDARRPLRSAAGACLE